MKKKYIISIILTAIISFSIGTNINSNIKAIDTDDKTTLELIKQLLDEKQEQKISSPPEVKMKEETPTEFFDKLNKSIDYTDNLLVNWKGFDPHSYYEADKPWIRNILGLDKLIYDEERKQTQILEENNKILKENNQMLKDIQSKQK